MVDAPFDAVEMIKAKRAALGFSPADFAEFVGVGRGESGAALVDGWEAGKVKPSPSKVRAIAALNTSTPFRSTNLDPSFRFIDLFAGLGGIRLPFQEIGGECVFTSEWDGFAKVSYATNFGEMPSGDIRAVAASDIPAHDLLLAGFPCQAFSRAGLGNGFNDTRGTMFFEIQRILAAHRPKAFLLENVKQLKGHDGGRTLETILAILRGDDTPELPLDVPMSDDARESLGVRLNYNVGYQVLSATNFGVPQKRERVYIVGFDRDQVSDVDIEAMLGRLAASTSETRLGDVLECNETVDPKYTISDKALAGLERRRASHEARGNGFGHVIVNRESRYCNTLTTRYGKDGSEALIDQTDLGKNPRKMIPRECARVQGFPEEYIIDAVSNA